MIILSYKLCDAVRNIIASTFTSAFTLTVNVKFLILSKKTILSIYVIIGNWKYHSNIYYFIITISSSSRFKHPAVYYKKKCIDIIHNHEVNWVNCWTTENENYKRIYKSVDEKNFSINDILNEILILTKKY